MIFCLKMIAAVLFGLILAFAGISYASDRVDNPKGVIVYAEQCREGLENLLSNTLRPFAENIGLAEIRVEIAEANIVKNTPRIILAIFTRVLEEAYLVGFSPDGPDDPQKYVTRDIREIFEAKPFEKVFEIPCPAPYGKESFYEPRIQQYLLGAIQNIELYWLQQRETEYLKILQKQFNLYFEPAFTELILRFNKEKKFLFQEILFFEQYKDHTFTELNLFMDTYAMVCREHINPLVRDEIFKGIQDPNKLKIFQVTIQLQNNKEKIISDIDSRAETLANRILNYFIWTAGRKHNFLKGKICF